MLRACYFVPWCVFCACSVIWGPYASRQGHSEKDTNNYHLSVDHSGAVLEQANAAVGKGQFTAPTEKKMRVQIRAFQSVIADESVAVGVVDRVDANYATYSRATRNVELDHYESEGMVASSQTNGKGWYNKVLGLKDADKLGGSNVGARGLQLRVLPIFSRTVREATSRSAYILKERVTYNITVDYTKDPDVRRTAGMNGMGKEPRRWFEITRGQKDGLPLTYLPWLEATCTYSYMEPNSRAFLSGPFSGCVAYIAVKGNEAMVVHCNRAEGDSYEVAWKRVHAIAAKEKLKSNGWKDLKLIHQHNFKNESGRSVPGWDLKMTGSHWLWGVKELADGPWKFGYLQNSDNGGHKNNDPHDQNMQIASF